MEVFVSTIGSRPSLLAAFAESDFTRWYWTCAEPGAFYRSQGLSSAGVKADLAARVAAHLGGHDARFEYTRFAQVWHAAHPGGTAAQCRAAWRAHRALPNDARSNP